MSITNKMMNFGNKSTVELEQLQVKLQEGLAETRERIKIYMQKVTTLRVRIEHIKDEDDNNDKEITAIRRKISILEEDNVNTHNDEIKTMERKISKIKDEIADHGKEIKTMERKMSTIKDEIADLKDSYKDDMESLKAVEQVLKIREEKKTAKANRLYGGLGALAIVGGVGLAYGSDTWGTLVNKHTMDAVKLAVTRFLPKLI